MPEIVIVADAGRFSPGDIQMNFIAEMSNAFRP
jgi:hypothetical protein